jgi:Natural resistance-associated macrophage protein
MSIRAKSKLAHHPRRGSLRGHGYFKRLGPGIVTGAADDDPSGIATYSQVGAAQGLSLLWMAPFLLPLAVGVQESTARLGLVTGKGLGTLIRERFPRWVLVGAVLLVASANTLNIAADLASMGAALRLLVPVPDAVGVVLFAAAIGVTEVLVPYHRVGAENPSGHREQGFRATRSDPCAMPRPSGCAGAPTNEALANAANAVKRFDPRLRCQRRSHNEPSTRATGPFGKIAQFRRSVTP